MTLLEPADYTPTTPTLILPRKRGREMTFYLRRRRVSRSMGREIRHQSRQAFIFV